MKKIKYLEYICELIYSKYATGNNRLQLVDANDGIPVTMASLNPAEILKEDEIAVKNYSENEGMLDFLIENNIVGPPHRYSIERFPICKLKK